MKLKSLPTIIAVALSALFAFAGYSLCKNQDIQWALTIAGFIAAVFPLGTTLGASFENGRTSTNIKVLSGVFFAIILIVNTMFAFTISSIPVLIIVNGIVLLIWLLIAYTIAKANK